MTVLSETPPAGLLLVDHSLTPLASNEEAIQILTYPHRDDKKRLNGSLTDKIRSILNKFEASKVSFITEFRSGNRRYLCRAFRLNAGAKEVSCGAVALLFERGVSGSLPISQVSERYDLTLRERETVEYLMLGLTSKEIASRMRISPNTVKNFIRMVMLKMGVPTRSAIIGRMVGSLIAGRVAPLPERGSDGETESLDGFRRAPKPRFP